MFCAFLFENFVVSLRHKNINRMNKEFFFYNCQLEGRQLCLDETEMLPAKIVLRSICDADYQENLLADEALSLLEYCGDNEYSHKEP